MIENIQNMIMNPKEAVGLLKQLIIEDFRQKLPRHPYVQSYFTEELGMSEKEANARAEISRRMFPKHPSEKPPICEEFHESNGSTLIISDPDCLLLTEHEGKYYRYPISWKLYRHIARRITKESSLKMTGKITTDNKKNVLFLNYTFSHQK